MRTPVAIVGAGPAGLVLSQLLAQAGIDSVVLEDRERDYVERRVRAGVLEQGSVDLLRAMGVAKRLDREGLAHHGIELRFEGRGHRIALSELSGGRAITIYGQQELVKDLIQARLTDGGTIHFDAPAVALAQIDTPEPVVIFEQDGARQELQADFVAGCDGFHGVCRAAIPPEALRIYETEYPFAWLGILAAVPPSTEELIYARHERGFALHSLRSPQISRLYLQVRPDESLDNWPDERIWQELRARFATDDGWTLRDGPVLEKGITAMRSYVAEPMRFGRLYLAGDAAHIVPATGAKGMNLAINDARLLAAALSAWYQHGRGDLLDAYSASCLRRAWRVQHFSWWMTSMMHRFEDPFQDRLGLSQLRYVCSSTAAATSLAENYVGLESV